MTWQGNKQKKSRIWNTVWYQWPSFFNKTMGVADRGDGGKNCSTLKRDLKDLTNKSNM